MRGSGAASNITPNSAPVSAVASSATFFPQAHLVAPLLVERVLQTRERLFRAPARLRLAHGEHEDHEGDRAADQQGRQCRHQRPSPQRRKRRERQRPFAAAEAQPLGGDQGFAARRAEAAVVEQPRRLRLRTVVDAEFEQWRCRPAAVPDLAGPCLRVNDADVTS